MEKVVGVLFPDRPVFSDAAKAAVSGGLTISVLISRGETSPSTKTISSSSSIASSETSGLLLRQDYRPINEAKSSRGSSESRETEDSLVKKILSFGPQLEKKESFGDERNHEKGLTCKKERVEYSIVEERCLDLNLELRISPPWQDQQQHHEETKLRFGREKYRCIACHSRLGNDKECSCDDMKCQIEDSSSTSYSSSDISSSAVGYDFLSLNTSVLDFSSLEMN